MAKRYKLLLEGSYFSEVGQENDTNSIHIGGDTYNLKFDRLDRDSKHVANIDNSLSNLYHKNQGLTINVQHDGSFDTTDNLSNEEELIDSSRGNPPLSDD